MCIRDRIPTADLNTALQGKVAGVFIQNSAKPGEAASIKIRGNNSIQYGTSPIYVIDGLLVDQGFEMLNPNDIATIDVLKDASATAIYGARGANGVVVITTKKGQKGKARVTYDGWYGSQTVSYTHLTLPTKREEYIFWGPPQHKKKTTEYRKEREIR